MPQPLSEYFALEASDFLNQLDALVAAGGAVDAARLVRLARGVRGSAQVAGAADFAAAAERFEEGARAIRDGALAWDEEVRQRVVRTVDDLRVLLRAPENWGVDERARADAVRARWAGAAEPMPAQRPAAAAAGTESMFAFVEHELSAVADELDRAGAELRQNPAARDTLRLLLRRMRPVRGVSGLPALAPVLEVLEALEDLAHDVIGRSFDVDARHLALLAAARQALAAFGRDLARGEPPSVGAEMQAFRAARDGAEAPEPGAPAEIPVTVLFSDDAGAHVVASPVAPVPPADGSVTPEIEGFLRIEATGFLDRADALAATAAPERAFAPTARQLAEIAAHVGELAQTYRADAIARAAVGAEADLRSADSAAGAREALLDLRAALPGAAPRPPRAAPVSPPALQPAEEVIPIESLLYDRDGALAAALALREPLRALLGAAPPAPLTAALDELFALLELARA